jgi:hypothetical protein
MTILEQIFNCRPQQIGHHGIVYSITATPVDGWDTNNAHNIIVDTSFVQEGGRLLGWLKFDLNYFSSPGMFAQVNIVFSNKLRDLILIDGYALAHR